MAGHTCRDSKRQENAEPAQENLHGWKCTSSGQEDSYLWLASTAEQGSVLWWQSSELLEQEVEDFSSSQQIPIISVVPSLLSK